MESHFPYSAPYTGDVFPESSLYQAVTWLGITVLKPFDMIHTTDVVKNLLLDTPNAVERGKRTF